MKSSTSEFLTIRGLKSHVRLWGPPDAPKLFLLHGWMDCSASFQFLVDAFAREWRVIAPDWRGFGQSEWLHRSYWFPDYLADLERLLDHYAPEEAVRLIGHSMGGNVVGLYAGARPVRVAKLAILEGFGLHPTDPAQAPGRSTIHGPSTGANSAFGKSRLKAQGRVTRWFFGFRRERKQP